MEKIAGPEGQTLVERIVGWFGLPYATGCALVILAVFSLPPAILTSLLEGSNFLPAIAQSLRQLQTPEGHILRYFVPIYLFYAPYYMRMNVLQTEHAISTLLPNKEEDFHRHFGKISLMWPQLAIWGALSFLLVSASPNVFQAPRTENVAFNLTYVVFTNLGLASLIWTYLSSLRGIHEMGSVSLSLRPYYEDNNLGLKAIGSLSLTLAWVYFGAIALSVVIALVVGSPITVSTLAFLVGFILFGLLMFFLPLGKLHQVMLRQKRAERAKLTERLCRLYGNPVEEKPGDELSRVFYLQSILDMTERKISSIATWPFDTQILGKLIAIVLTVTAITISRLIQLSLNL